MAFTGLLLRLNFDARVFSCKFCGRMRSGNWCSIGFAWFMVFCIHFLE